MSCTRLFSLLLAGAFCAPALSAPVWVPTNYGNGADAEVREAFFDVNYGINPNGELATRINNTRPAGDPNDSGDRNSLMYVKIDLTGYGMPADGKTAFRMTYFNSNLVANRVQDNFTPNPDFRTGLTFYGLRSGNTWDESTITYANAPGINFPGDLNIGTRDLSIYSSSTTPTSGPTGLLQPLGTVTFSQLGDAGKGIAGPNRMPIGGELVFESPNLDAFVKAAIDNGDTEVTLVSHVTHDGSEYFHNFFPQWMNHNYVFNAKEKLTLNIDNANWDADVLDPDNPLGNPLSGASNANGEFSPSLLLQAVVPEPTSAVLCLGALAGIAGLRRRG